MNDFRPVAASTNPTRHPLTVIGLRLLSQHRSIGLLILNLMALRVLARVVNRVRMARHDLPRVLALVSSAGHLGHYALLLATPLLGLALTWAYGQDIALLGLVQMPHLLTADPDLADTLGNWHPIVGWSLLAVVVADAPTLWDHLIRRDGVLIAMLPGSSSDGTRV
jgi:cytochrome b561